VKNCPACSAPTKEEMKYCPRCGTRLASSEEDPPVDSVSPPAQASEALDYWAKNSHPKLDWKRVSIFSGLFIVLVVGGVWAAIYSFEQSKIARAEQQELVASSCALKLQKAAPEISNGVFYYDLEEYGGLHEEISVTVVDSSGAKIGSYLTCAYSIDRPSKVVHVESARWHRVVGATEYVVEYNRESNVITSEIAESPILIDETPPASEQLDSSCEQAFREAASVPLSQDNNSEIRETTWSCGSVDEWWSMLQNYPDVFGMTFYPDSEKSLYVGSACLVGSGSPVCEDAERKGLTF